MTVEVGEYLDLYIPQFGGSYTGEVDHVALIQTAIVPVEGPTSPGCGALSTPLL